MGTADENIKVIGRKDKGKKGLNRQKGFSI